MNLLASFDLTNADKETKSIVLSNMLTIVLKHYQTQLKFSQLEKH